MKFIRRLINKCFPKQLAKPLGRWNIDYCNKKLDKKIDLSNEDHCGPCGQYVITRLPNNTPVKPTQIVPFVKNQK